MVCILQISSDIIMMCILGQINTQGRGVIQTSGVCNFGKLNYFLGKRASDDSRESRYPTIDFCKDPEAICSNKNYPELKWVSLLILLLLFLLLLLCCFFVHGGLELTLIHSSYRLLVSSIGSMKFKPTMRMDGTI